MLGRRGARAVVRVSKFVMQAPREASLLAKQVWRTGSLRTARVILTVLRFARAVRRARLLMQTWCRKPDAASTRHEAQARSLRAPIAVAAAGRARAPRRRRYRPALGLLALSKDGAPPGLA